MLLYLRIQYVWLHKSATSTSEGPQRQGRWQRVEHEARNEQVQWSQQAGTVFFWFPVMLERSNRAIPNGQNHHTLLPHSINIPTHLEAAATSGQRSLEPDTNSAPMRPKSRKGRDTTYTRYWGSGSPSLQQTTVT
jgi:hypothetical protein